MTLTANTHKRRLTLSVPGQPRPAASGEPVREAKSQFSSRELFSGQRQIHIRHNDDTYRLSITKQGKLILTK